MNKPYQSASVMYQARTPDNGQIFLQFSVYLNRSYSSFSFFSFFVVFSFFALSHFLFFIFIFMFFLSPLPVLSSSLSCCLSMHKSRQKEKSPECQPMAQWQSSTKKANWAPGPCANFRKFLERMPVLPVEESCLIHTYSPAR